MVSEVISFLSAEEGDDEKKLRHSAAIQQLLPPRGGKIIALQQNGYDCNRRSPVRKGKPLKLHLTTSGVQNLCTAYGDGYVAVNQRRIETNVVILPESLVEPWLPTSFQFLTEADFVALAQLKIELLLLGTGPRLHFPHPRLTEPLRAAGIGFEAMDTPAACRTYNILVSEGRQVAAALFVV